MSTEMKLNWACARLECAMGNVEAVERKERELSMRGRENPGWARAMARGRVGGARRTR